MERTFTARDVLTYLYAESKWTEDVDGDAHDDGSPYCIVNHDIRISNGLLDELIDMAGIKKNRYDETALEALERANGEDQEREYREREMQQLGADGQL